MPQHHVHSRDEHRVPVCRVPDDVVAEARVLDVVRRPPHYRNMQRTVSIPVDLPSDRFLPLLAECAEVFNHHVEWALGERTYSKAKAHRALYEEQRSLHPDVPSALIQTVRDTALEAVKATAFEKRPRKKPRRGCATTGAPSLCAARRSPSRASAPACERCCMYRTISARSTTHGPARAPC